LFTPTVVFVSAANNVILRNLLDLPYNWETVARFLHAYGYSLLATVPVFALAIRWRAFAFVARAILMIGVSVILFDSIAGLTQSRVTDIRIAGLLDIGGLAAAILLVSLPRFRVLLQVFAVIAPVLLLNGVVSHARTIWRVQASLDQRREQALDALKTRTPRVAARRGNVYHVVLDAFQREAYEILTTSDPALRLDGFTYFSRFTAGYFLTFYSLPHLLTGRPYSAGESFHNWQHEVTDAGVWSDLAAGGIELSLYPHWDSFCSRLARDCHSTVTAIGELQKSAFERLTADLWFQSLLPRSVRSLAAGEVDGFQIVRDAGAGVVKNNAPNVSFSAANWFIPSVSDDEIVPGAEFLPWEDLLTIASVANFERMLDDESKRPSQGQYVFVHTMVPHHPYVVDSECRYKGPGTHPSIDAPASVVAEAYLAQARCGLRLIGKLVNRLKALGRFEDALIIVHGDHGMDTDLVHSLLSRHPELFTRERGNGNDEEVVKYFEVVGLRSHALLLVKFPAATGVSTSAKAAQMIDLAPTILNDVELPIEGYPGVPLQNLPENLDREIAFYAGAPEHDFFKLGNLESDLVFPTDRRFNKFVLEEDQWRHKSDVPVM
jgi:hypothetical protein